MLLTEWNWDDAKEVWQEEAKEEGRREGRQSGLIEGEMKGRQSGLKDGEIIGEMRGRKETALALLQDGTFSKEKIAEMTKLELTEVETLAEQL